MGRDGECVTGSSSSMSDRPIVKNTKMCVYVCCDACDARAMDAMRIPQYTRKRKGDATVLWHTALLRKAGR